MVARNEHITDDPFSAFPFPMVKVEKRPRGLSCQSPLSGSSQLVSIVLIVSDRPPLSQRLLFFSKMAKPRSSPVS